MYSITIFAITISGVSCYFSNPQNKYHSELLQKITEKLIKDIPKCEEQCKDDLDTKAMCMGHKFKFKNQCVALCVSPGKGQIRDIWLRFLTPC